MGRRDFVRREAKKPKKSAKKIGATPIPILPPAMTVEVIKRGKKEREEEEEETK